MINNILTKTKYYLFIIVLFATGCMYTSENLIINPGAELQPVKNGWIQVTGKWQQRAKDPVAQEGKNYFFPGSGKTAELYQDIDVSAHASLIDMGFFHAHYSAYMRAWHQKPTDEALEVIEYRNAAGDVLDSFKTKTYTNTTEWMHVADSRIVPKSTRTIRVRLLAIRHNGSNNDGYHDNLSLTLQNRLPLYIIIVIVALIVLLLIAKKKLKKK